MPETLGKAMDEIKAEVANFLGWSRGTAFDEPAWTAREQAKIDSITNMGLGWFYRPEPMEALPSGYDWSFMHPVATFTLASGAQTLALPDDFGGIEGRVTVSATSASGLCPIPVVGDVRLRYALTPDASGRPEMVCIDPLKGTSKTKGQQFQLMFFPEADQAYTISFGYYFCGYALSSSFPYHHGGPQHSDTVVAACIAAAELDLDDTRGVRWVAFQGRLMASIVADRRMKPQLLGYNRDRSDDREAMRLPYNRFDQSITFAGVEVDDY